MDPTQIEVILWWGATVSILWAFTWLEETKRPALQPLRRKLYMDRGYAKLHIGR